MSSLLSMIIIWCDISFDKDEKYKSMKDEFNETTTGTPKKSLDPIDMAIFNTGKEELQSNNVPLITIQTCDDAMRQIEKHKDKKVFVICSGTIGRYLVPQIVGKHPHVHNFYIFAHNIVLHMDWAREYTTILKMFNFHTDLLVRLTRDIADYFIQQGRMYLEVDGPQEALICFEHAQKLEIQANVRDQMEPNPNNTESCFLHADFRENLDLLEGDNGLISQAQAAIRAKEYPLQNS